MQWLKRRDERGATAVVVALLLVVLMGFGTLAVDVGGLWVERKLLQNGADAAALAIAQACASDPDGSDCSNPEALGKQFADDNNYGPITGLGVDLTLNGSAGEVEVQTHNQRASILATVFGVSTTDVSAASAAVWGGAPSQMATIPFTVSYCQFRWQNGAFEGTPGPGSVIIKFKSQWKDFPLDKSDELTCMDNAAHNEAGGGFGYLSTSGSKCETVTSVGGVVDSSPGNGFDKGCTKEEVQRILGKTPGKTVLIPLFDEHNAENGANAQFTISGFAAIKIDAYCVGLDTGGNFAMPATISCGGNNARIEGSFVGFSVLGDLVDDGGGADYGVTSVRLTLPKSEQES